MSPKDLISVDREIELPSQWDYETSVIRCRNLFREVKEKGAEGLTELYIAHKLLTEDSKRKTGRKWPGRTFQGYCEEVGIDETTGYRWLHIYFNLPRRPILANTSIPLLPEGKFDVIYADPPWRYEFSETEPRSIEAHYDTLSLEEICNYKDGNGTPVQEKFGNNAVLFIWATQPKIREALQVIETWGFEYRTGAIWVKDKFGMGYYFREQHELLFVAKKGDMPVPKPDARPPSVISAPRTKHSKKPNDIYKIIEKMYPRDRYLEIFGREKYSDKWEVVGLEVEEGG